MTPLTQTAAALDRIQVRAQRWAEAERITPPSRLANLSRWAASSATLQLAAVDVADDPHVRPVDAVHRQARSLEAEQDANRALDNELRDAGFRYRFSDWCRFQPRSAIVQHMLMAAQGEYGRAWDSRELERAADREGA